MKPKHFSFLKRLCMLSLFMFLSIIALAQTRTIKGKITDANGNPLTGATVQVKGSSKTATTNDQGAFEIQVSDNNAILVISFIGKQEVELAIDSKDEYEIKMTDSDVSLSEVFISATQKPVRKLETVTAVERIGQKELAKLNPVNFVDAVRFTPGVFVNTGPGRTRNGVFVRGFPDLGSNGLVYTSLLFDGLRTFASPELVPDAAFRMDLGTDRIEVVRGSAATLFGRGAAAGAINVISKTGGVKTAGAIRVTSSNNSMLQFDGNINGAINKSKSLRYNLSGFYLTDKGFRDNPFKDKGYQVRANIDYLLPNNKGNIRLYGGNINLNIQNQIDLPYVATDLTKPALGYTSKDMILNAASFQTSALNRTINISYPDGKPELINIPEKMEKGNFSKGNNIGVEFNFNLGKGWSVSNKGRYQDMIVGTQFDFPLTTNYNNTQTRVLFVGNGNGDGGSHAKDFINEFRIQKTIEGKHVSHTITAGYYFSNVKVNAAAIGYLYTIGTLNPASRNSSIAGVAPSLFRNGIYKETVNSVFIGDEMKVNGNLTINAGLRQDWINLDLTEDRYTDASQRNATRKPKHDGLSGSIGFNYLVNKKSALYGNYVRAYRAPDYSAYTTVVYAKYTRDANNNITGITRLVGADPLQYDEKGRVLYLNNYIDDNEIINSFEVGYRTSIGRDFDIDAGVFYNDIKNRLISSFIGATAVQVPGGNNRIFGSEISLYYNPKGALKGFYARSSITLQSTKYTKLDQSLSFTQKITVTGNAIAGVPRTIWNISLGYDKNNFSINFNNNMMADRPIDVFNTAKYPTTSIADANIGYKLKIRGTSGIKLKFSVTNLFNDQSAINVVSASTDNVYYNARINNYSGNFTHVRGVPQLPRRAWFSVEYNF